MKINRTQRQEMQAIASEMALLKARCFRVGLYPTGHALDNATTIVGYDIARVLTGDRIPKEVLRKARMIT